MEKTYHLMATAAAGLESLVGKELERLGYDPKVENYRVRFDGTARDILNANIWLRTADRVKIIVGEFDATTFDDLFEGVKALPWEDYLNYDSEFPVAGRSKKSELFSVPDVQAITKKAIVNRLQEAYHIRTRLPENGYFAQLEVMIDKDHVIVTLDTTGPSLFKRGYRVNKGGAPLKENFAAALVLLTNWHPDRPFVDPTTGLRRCVMKQKHKQIMTEHWIFKALISMKIWYKSRLKMRSMLALDKILSLSNWRPKIG